MCFIQAETLKYFYLLFGPNDILPLDKVVFNTEAHPLPVFKMGKLQKTGWARKPRNADGEIIVASSGSSSASSSDTASAAAKGYDGGLPNAVPSGAADAAGAAVQGVAKAVGEGVGGAAAAAKATYTDTAQS